MLFTKLNKLEGGGVGRMTRSDNQWLVTEGFPSLIHNPSDGMRTTLGCLLFDTELCELFVSIYFRD